MIVAFIVLEPVFLQTVTYSQADLSQGGGKGAKEQAANRGLREPCLAGTMPRCGPHGRVKILDTKFPGELRLPPVPKYGRSLSSRLLILYNSIVVGQSSPRNLKDIDVFYVVFP